MTGVSTENPPPLNKDGLFVVGSIRPHVEFSDPEMLWESKPFSSNFSTLQHQVTDRLLS